MKLIPVLPVRAFGGGFGTLKRDVVCFWVLSSGNSVDCKHVTKPTNQSPVDGLNKSMAIMSRPYCLLLEEQINVIDINGLDIISPLSDFIGIKTSITAAFLIPGDPVEV